jgi:hypothetical protein
LMSRPKNNSPSIKEKNQHIIRISDSNDLP